MTTTGERGVLYAVACGAPPTRDLPVLVDLAHQAGWDVCVIATPAALKWLDVGDLERRTGHPVRSDYKAPAEPDVLPPADAFLVAPATSNTVNKWAAGISDTLALGLVVEASGAGLPVVVVPSTSDGLAAFPAFERSLATLRDCGVTVLFDGNAAPAPDARPAVPGSEFPWRRALEAVHERLRHPGS